MKISLNCKGEWDLVSVLKLAGIIKKFSPDIIHAHDAHAHTILLLASLIGKKRPLVISRRVDFSTVHSLFSRWKYQTSRICKIITVSKSIKKVLLRDGIPEKKIAVVYSGIPLKDISKIKAPFIRQKLSIPKKAKILGCIANFADHKDHYTLLRVFKSLAEKRKDFYLVLVGNGPLYQKIKTECGLLSCGNRIIFTGYQKDIYPYLMHFDIFVLTSYLEGLCTSLIDSLMLGVPIVASKSGGIPEIVQDGENGFLVEAGDISGFHEKILQLLENKNMYDAFREKCFLSAHNFSIKNTIANTLKIYKEIRHIEAKDAN